LGSSSFVTDETGKVYEHLEYFPFGETWAHEHSNTQVTPYRFTGKEYDETTGLYYYGARYYDPRTSVWQSPDPILGEYMSGKTNGGVFNPMNLSLFTYTYNNPVNLVDPDGEAPVKALELIAENRNNIMNTAKTYNVDPKAIASIILQEKYHGVFADIKNKIAYIKDGGVHENSPSTRSYGLGEMQLGLAGELLGIDANSKGGKAEIYSKITNNDTLAIDLIGKNISNAQKQFNTKLDPKGAAILHNAGTKGLKSYLNGEKLKGGVYDRSANWQTAIGKALEKGEISTSMDKKPLIKYKND